MLTCLKKYGETTNLKCEEHKEKIKLIHLKNLGVDNPFKSKEIQKQIKQTNIENIGVDNPFKSEIIKEKSRQTNIERYGVDNWSKSSQGRKCSRINFLKMIENQKLNGEPLCPRIGSNERICLNELQQYTVYKINRNDPFIGHSVGFFPDGHISELKLFIEFDERQHFVDNYKTHTQKDIDRELILRSIPGYRIFRISEKNWKENKNAILHDFSTIINELVLIQQF